MNRRGNGLSADAYAPLVDLAPHLADAMLTALREAGVAAYAASAAPAGEPAAGPADPGGRDVLDRLYVDVAMKPTAESVLQAHLTRLRDAGARGDGDGREADEPSSEPSPGAAPGAAGAGGTGGGTPTATDDARPGATAERDEDAIWAEIVAGFDTGPEDGSTPWPEQEDIRDERPGPPTGPGEGEDRTGRLPLARVIKPADAAGPASGGPAAPGPDAAGPDAADPDAADPDAADPDAADPDDEGHFVPPPPPPLPNPDPLTKGAWAALVGGPLYLLVTVVMDWQVPGWAAFLAVAAFIGGFVTLVLRMGDEPRDPDDGAVV
ncbi:hypothetical protein Acsp04_07180 [Actinomadura sp. NBRC 104425]|uniref:hypothetical protein n=1 Tax=Actinomadura sp. NBRC 104425 TaxID=3032204 RepID=UPI0024A4FAFB|nr:hypothetical protein [Actinomadura sp. NBRC 104425]GLZ10483.1 hypothetical protein Acsp04_07180 [Actinomadura sp. NBRC 104425]